MTYTYIEKCPKCGGTIEQLVLTFNPPIYKKRCTKCGASWERRPTFVTSVFNPEEQGYTETVSGGAVNSESNISSN